MHPAPPLLAASPSPVSGLVLPFPGELLPVSVHQRATAAPPHDTGSFVLYLNPFSPHLHLTSLHFTSTPHALSIQLTSRHRVCARWSCHSFFQSLFCGTQLPFSRSWSLLTLAHSSYTSNLALALAWPRICLS